MLTLLLYQLSVADYDNVRIAFYNANNTKNYELYSISEMGNITNHKDFDVEGKTVLYIHGFRENLTSQSVVTIIEAFIKRGEYNCLALDWSAYADGNYVTDAIPNLVKVI